MNKFFILICVVLPNLLTAGTPLERMKTRGDMLGWEAVGRVELDKKAFCTGVLIAPDQVLTAAHCLFDAKTGAPLKPSDIRFRSGYLDGKSLSDRNAIKYIISEGYVHPEGDHSLKSVAKDVAILKLDRPISNSEAIPFLVHHDGADVSQVQVMSYGRGRADAMSWQRQCAKLFQARGLMVFDCDITFGSSGAPVFAMHGTRVRILSLVSGITTGKNGEKWVLGAPLSELVTALQTRMRYGDVPMGQVGNGAKRITVGSKKGAGGAKFLSPKQ
ncbi:MAG: trypsin-like serine peptidase [Cognatishimia sp.]